MRANAAALTAAAALFCATACTGTSSVAVDAAASPSSTSTDTAATPEPAGGTCAAHEMYEDLSHVRGTPEESAVSFVTGLLEYADRPDVADQLADGRQHLAAAEGGTPVPAEAAREGGVANMSLAAQIRAADALHRKLTSGDSDPAEEVGGEVLVFSAPGKGFAASITVTRTADGWGVETFTYGLPPTECSDR